MVKESAAAIQKKKKWCTIVSTPGFENTVLGETPVTDTEQLIGRVINVNLMQLTKSPKKQSMNLKFKIESIHEGKGIATPTHFEIQSSSIKRLVRAGRDRIDDSFVTKSKDEKHSRVKPLLITKSHQPAAVRTKLRRLAATFLRKYVSDVSYEQFVREVVDGKVQKDLRDKLIKITPLRNCEIRAIELIENFTAQNAKKLARSLKNNKVDPVVAEEVVEAPKEEVVPTTE